ncbi:MAG: thiol reductant ABC exporter subunit CydC [Anaerolineae bacterium]|nr:thiol reductant ABC exporter subunit CydC [Anaerolineae bacterium]
MTSQTGAQPPRSGASASTVATRRLLRWLLPYWRGIAVSVLLGVLTIGSSIALLATSAWMISKAGLQPSIADLGVSIVGVRLFGIMRGVMRYLERLVSHDTTFRLLADIRVHVYRAIEPLAPARLSDFRTGDLLERVVADVEALQHVYLRAVAPSLVALLTGAMLTVLLAAFNGTVALLAVIWFAASAALVIALSRWLGQATGQTLVRGRGALNAALVDTLQGLPDLVAYGAADRQLALLEAQAAEVAVQERRFARLDALQSALLILLPAGAMLAVLALAIPRVEGIYLATLGLATLAAYEAIQPLGQAAAAWGSSLESAQHLFELMDTQPAVSDPATPASAPRHLHLTWQQVTFSYAPDQPPVLRDFDLQIAYGEHVAIVGESGAGKSTLINLLLRFWEVGSGSLRVGGIEVRDLPQEDLRRLFSVMTQQTHLFNTTIRENIRIARPDADDAAVEAAARAARIDSFVKTLPAGYETMTGENGLLLSGGERQRLALARVLLRDAPVLILDEATAHLDAKTEREVIDAVLNAASGRTLLLLTHNPALLPLLDRVVTLKRTEG